MSKFTETLEGMYVVKGKPGDWPIHALKIMTAGESYCLCHTKRCNCVADLDEVDTAHVEMFTNDALSSQRCRIMTEEQWKEAKAGATDDIPNDVEGDD